DGLVAAGVNLSVAQGTQGQVIIEESGGFTAVSETSSDRIGTSDSYTVRLAQRPTANVYVTVSAPAPPQDEADGLPAGDSILLDSGVALPGVLDYFRHIVVNGVPTLVKQRALVLVLTPQNWMIPQTVDVGAVNDSRQEGDRVVITSHSVLSA